MDADGRLDRTDIRILAALQAEGRLSNKALAERIALSPSACLERVRRLEATGVVSGYRAILDLTRVGAHLEVFADITLEGLSQSDKEAFEQAVRAAPEVVSADAVGGDRDYVLRFLVRDLAAYEAASQRLLDGSLGIKQLMSSFVIRRIKPETPPALDVLLGPA